MYQEKLQATTKNLPNLPGAYLFYAGDVVIYVGKAKNLKERVSSYFANFDNLNEQKKQMLENATDLKHIVLRSEIEALIMEANLIKKFQPKYNIVLKDDKSFLYIRISDEKFPRITLERKAQDETYEATNTNHKNQSQTQIAETQSAAADCRLYTNTNRQIINPKNSNNPNYPNNPTLIGPFTSAESLRMVMKMIQKVFPFRDCSPAFFSRHTKLQKPCLKYHIKRCPAPCLSRRSPDQGTKADLSRHTKPAVALSGYGEAKKYHNNIKNILKFLNGDFQNLEKSLEKEMLLLSKKQQYEEAALVRNKLESLRKILFNRKVINAKDESAEDDLNSLKRALNLKKIPQRIECYDISNIQGKLAVGSMVVFEDGRANKKEYRRFKIKMEEKPNDVAMMAEVIKRRFIRGTYAPVRLGRRTSNGTTRLAPNAVEGNKKITEQNLRHSWLMPDLIILDGGKPQLNKITKIFEEMKIDIPLIALAKRQEEIFFPHNPKPTLLPKNSNALYLLQNIRDEAHRFAISYHHLLRSKQIK